MRSGILAFLGGICAFWTLPELPPWPMTGLLLLSLIVALRWRGLAGRLLAGVALGMLWAWLSAVWALRWSWPEPVDLRAHWLAVRVVGLPRAEMGSLNFEARLLAVDDQPIPRWRQPLLRLAGQPMDGPRPRAGETWRVLARLRPAHGLSNPGGEDAERRYFEQGIRATGTILRPASARLLEPASPWSLDDWRQTLRDRLLMTLDGRPMAGLVAALVLGDDQAVPDEVWSVYRQTGTAHLVAISGSHITLVAGFVFLPAYWLWRRSTRLCLWLPARIAALGLSLGLVFVYSLLAGFAVPVQRALLMLLVLSLAAVQRRRIGVSAAFCAALLAVLLFDARAVLAPGFWLSFGAVAVILWLISGRSAEPASRSWLRLQAGISLALLPLTLGLFQQASLISPLANLLAVPWFGFVSLPLGLVGTLLLPFWSEAGGLLLRLAELSLAVVYPLLEWAAALPLATWRLGGVAMPALAAALAGLVLLMAPRGMPLRGLGLFLLLPLAGAALREPDVPAPLRLTVVDVGQGLSVVVETAAHVLVYDAGYGEARGYSSGTRAVAPLLRARAWRAVDRLIVSHGDADHAGGVPGLRAELPVADILSGEPGRIAGASACRAGQAWHWDGVDFEILHPREPAWQGNDASCVLRIRYREQRILVTGDIEARAERALLETQGAALAADLLIAPHHGSLSSSSPDFVAAVQARWVVFPVGYQNRFQFPRERVLARYRRGGAVILRSDRDGAISFGFGGQGAPVIERHRPGEPAIWRHRLPELPSPSLPEKLANMLE